MHNYEHEHLQTKEIKAVKSDACCITGDVEGNNYKGVIAV